MSIFPQLLEEIINYFEKFPGVGRKSAERFVMCLLNMNTQDLKTLGNDILEINHRIRPCKECNNIADSELCKICSDPQRDKSVICVVEEPKDVIAVEKTGKFRGVYHVLLGSISPLESKLPKDIDTEKLIRRVEKYPVKEVIIATDSDASGEATAFYVKDILKDKNVNITRIALGIPMGADLELVDLASLSCAFENRRPI